MSFPDKENRTKCWAARDAYWQCLDKYNPNFNPNSNETEPEQCTKLMKDFHASCPKQWIKHFDRKRLYEQFKEQMQKGYDPLESKTKT